ncbi:PLP-dependent aminotransferase family protein [Paenibacillus macerans]|uniref:aminotransferase-like domain-containing protein n=1 Tax=Paenibacillus macerans TaxID=44252 RepID=UPI001F0E76E7|nr:PLP-dependent aminotransferase family protein [Paenibacillus macerans]UMV47590.1 PLP-dependent aminotransferase family protein [Paenibacillus macerans]
MPDFTIALQSFSDKYRYKYLALYHALRDAIHNGTLAEGTRLPATRDLAAMYGLSRGSVSQAYDMLHAEGYVRTIVGSGTFVTGMLAPRQETSDRKAQVVLSPWGRRVVSVMDRTGNQRDARLDGGTAGDGDGDGRFPGAAAAAVASPEPAGVISYRDGGPWEALFPAAEWKSALAWAARGKSGGAGGDGGSDAGVSGAYGAYGACGSGAAGAGGSRADTKRAGLDRADPGGAAGESADPGRTGADPLGELELRQAIAAHLRRSRGISADAEQICLFNGSMQAITLLTQLLLGEGEPAVLEDPCYYGIARAVAACGGVAVPAQLDGHGIVPRDWDARLLFVTPGRQFPTGAVLSHARRRELLKWASRRNAVIVEDDYDSEFRWGGRPLEPLKALDQEERVIYIGSFSKTMFAALRIGYAVLPRSLVRALASAKALYEPAPPARLEQRALARFMRTGGYDRHLRRMRRYYGAKQEVFRTRLESELGGLFRLQPADAGLLMYALWRKSPEEYRAFQAAATRRGVLFRDAAIYRLTPGEPAACFCFAHLDEEALLEGVNRMKAAWIDIQVNGN